MKKSLKYFLYAAGIVATTQCSMLAALAQTTVSTNNADPDFLAPASATAVAAAQAQANTSAAQGSQGYTTQTSGANELHTQVLNPTNQQNSMLGLNRTGTATLAPVFGF